MKNVSIETIGWMRLKVKTKMKAKLQMNVGITFMDLKHDVRKATPISTKKFNIKRKKERE